MKQSALGHFFTKKAGSSTDTNGRESLNDRDGSEELSSKQSMSMSQQHPGVKKKRTLPPSMAVPLMSTSSISSTKSYSSEKSSPPNADSISRSSQKSTSAFVGTFQRKGESSTTPSNHSYPTPSESSPSISMETEYTLSQSQKRVLDAVMQRKSVFFTGPAGTGKSYILKVLMEIMQTLELSDKISFTAPTGVAACNIRGLTIHSWAGVGTAHEPVEQLQYQVKRNSQASRRWKETEILVVDEVSMLSAELFDKLDIIGRRIRGNLQPFGGLQIVLCGDFFQLPPVGLGKNTHFCFDSNAWKEIFIDDNQEYRNEMIVLDKVFRQQDDSIFLNILNELRKGVVSYQTNQLLIRKVQEANYQDQAKPFDTTAAKKDGTKEDDRKTPIVRPTKLFSTNQDVDNYNMQELQQLSDVDEAEPRLYLAVDDGRDPYLSQMRNGTKAPQSLLLKVGAQVMLLKNLSTESGLVNGARGTVISFERSYQRSSHYPWLPVVKFQVIMGNDKHDEVVTLNEESWDVRQGETVLASRIQIPLILAWAISIHKSQGMTIPLLEVSFNRMFEYGQAYVALSRATCLQGLTLRSFQSQAVKAHPQVKQFYDSLHQRNQQFTNLPRIDNTVTVTLKMFTSQFTNERSNAPDENAWIDSRNQPTKKTTSQQHNTTSTNFQEYAYDEWLEKKVPVSSTATFQRASLLTNDSSNNKESSWSKNGGGVKFVPGEPFTVSEPLIHNKQEKSTVVKEYRRAESTSVIDLLSDDNNHGPFSTYGQEHTTGYTTLTPSIVGYGDVHKVNTNTAKETNISAELKRKIEENRLKALEKLEAAKRRRMEETSRVMNQYNI